MERLPTPDNDERLRDVRVPAGVFLTDGVWLPAEERPLAPRPSPLQVTEKFSLGVGQMPATNPARIAPRTPFQPYQPPAPEQHHHAQSVVSRVALPPISSLVYPHAHLDANTGLAYASHCQPTRATALTAEDRRILSRLPVAL
uniref:Uncharacterized protein n=1 Tax=Mycena chlorophos TaxID=658473 RepID=A0ABQ0LMT3_MYCCL|nr:predicted protein [Mycena chlorophos]